MLLLTVSFGLGGLMIRSQVKPKPRVVTDACQTSLLKQLNQQPVQATIANRQYALALSDTPTLRERGLSGTACLQDREGMLFVFDKPGMHGFWMKDMRYPIDIIWLDANKKVDTIVEKVLPASYPHSFAPENPSLYTIELKTGEVDRLGLRKGDTITF